MGHGLKLIMFYVQKHIAALGMCHNPALVRDKPLGVPTSVKLVYTSWILFIFTHLINQLQQVCRLLTFFFLKTEFEFLAISLNL